jgi:short-subunit dehydrogenase
MRVFITGASSGIGAALARQYAARGATLALVARRAPQLETLCQSLPAPASGEHRIYPLDVTAQGALGAAAEEFMAREGTPDVVIANAGIASGPRTGAVSEVGEFERIIATNVLAMAYTFQPFIAPMRAREGARLVGIGSVAGVRGLPGSQAYSASKAAVRTYCESLRVELYRSSIRVVTIAPGFIATAMTAGNPYPMPFLMPLDRFAARAVRLIDRGSSYAVLPWQMGVVAKLLAILPNPVYDWAFSRVSPRPRPNARR